MAIRSGGQEFCIWGGPATLVLFGLAILPAAHFLPPLAPTLSPVALAGIYQAHTIGIRVGALLLMGAVGTYMAYSAAISGVIKRIEGDVAPLAYAQLAGGLLALIPFLSVAILWTAAAFRPERSPETIQLLNDLAWLFMVMPAPSGVLQPIVTAYAVLTDKSATPVLPRWVGYFNVWVSLLFLPGGLCAFFMSGPFAWNGLLAFWLPAVVFGIYMPVMTVAMVRANRVG